MKRLLTLFLLPFCVLSYAQDDIQKAAAEAAAAMLNTPQVQDVVKKPSNWNSSIKFDLGFSQTGLLVGQKVVTTL